MVKKTVLKVDISCHKCKKKLLKAISALQGVDKIEVDAAKGTISVTGEADPYEIIVKTRKVGKFVELLSVGPPPPPKQEPAKKPDEKKPEPKKDDKKPDPKPQVHDPSTCPVCHQMSIVYLDRYPEPNPTCSIM